MGDRPCAIRFYNAAAEAIKNKNYQEWATHAFGLMQSACLVDPTFGQGWADNGHSNGDLNRLHSAIACYRRALDGDIDTENKVKVLTNLAWRCYQIGEFEQGMEFAKQSVEVDPTKPYGWVNLSIAHGAFGERTACVGAAYKAYELAPTDTAVQFNLAFALLFDEQYAEGFKHFEARFEHRLQNYLTYPYPKWLGEPDKQVFLVADQGMGDTLSFSRFLPLAAKRAKYLHVMVQPALMRAFNEAFVKVPNVNFTPFSTSYPQADAWTTFVSLPFALGLTDDEIKAAPHPKLPVYGMATTWKVPDVKLHVGIAWGGAKKNDIDQWRELPLIAFLDLYKVPGVQLYSLQMDDHKKDLVSFCCEGLVRDLSGWVNDVVDCTSVLQHLDLVITCESFLGHLAGALNKEVWIPYSFHAHDYRLGHDGSAILWYKKHRLFRQDRNLRWDTVFERMRQALQEKVDALGTADQQAGKVEQGLRRRAVVR